jgi:nucleotide-binding universal stress UspA family protein
MVAKAMRVLVAIDGSEAAEIAVDLVAGLAWPAGTEITVVEAVEPGAGMNGGPWPALAVVRTDRIEAELQAAAENTVDAVRERLARTGLNVKALVLRGRPGSAIVDWAREIQADLVVVGSRGHGTIASMVLGSVSAEVVDHASAPVLVARGGRVGRIVLGWDGSAGASCAAEVLRSWPIFAGSAIQVVSVANLAIAWWTGFPEASSPDTMPMYVDAVDAIRTEHQELAREMADRLRSDGFRTDGERREGDPATEILAAANASSADLIAIGTHGRTGLKRLLLGSVARNVLQHARCSVLIVREGTTPATAGPPSAG